MLRTEAMNRRAFIIGAAAAAVPLIVEPRRRVWQVATQLVRPEPVEHHWRHLKIPEGAIDFCSVPQFPKEFAFEDAEGRQLVAEDVSFFRHKDGTLGASVHAVLKQPLDFVAMRFELKDPGGEDRPWVLDRRS